MCIYALPSLLTRYYMILSLPARSREEEKEQKYLIKLIKRDFKKDDFIKIKSKNILFYNKIVSYLNLLYKTDEVFLHFAS